MKINDHCNDDVTGDTAALCSALNAKQGSSKTDTDDPKPLTLNPY